VNIIIGETGNDRVCGGSGNDILAGRDGADKIRGNGNDMLLHGDDTTSPALLPDGSRDVINCGPGNDSA
jgi:Ca2+-binding RTX toxin-like protein